MESLKDKVVLITGASRGIGASTAVLFAKYGSRLVLTGRNQERLNNTVEKCVAAGLDKNKILALTGDVTINADLDKLVKSCEEKFGEIHVLVNNAAEVKIGKIQELPMELLDISYMTNLAAVIYLCKLTIPYLKKTKGTIINISSMFSARPAVDYAAYCILKAGLDMLTKNLALELAADGIRVNAVRPGDTRTGVDPRAFGIPEDSKEADEMYKSMAEKTPLRRVATPEEITNCIAFLASDASSFTTGALFDVDGGALLTAAWTQ